MSRRDFSEIGRRFGRAVRDAARTGRLDEIGRAVGETVQTVAEEVNEAMGQSGSAQPEHPYSENSVPPASSPPPGKEDAPWPQQPPHRRQPGRTAGILYTVFGLLGALPMAVLDACCAVAVAVGVVSVRAFAVTAAILYPATAVLIFLAVYGTRLRGRSKRYGRYCDCLGAATFAPVAELAATVGRSPDAVRRELRWMIRAGWFAAGHLDEQETCLIADDDTYAQYLEAERAREEREAAARREEAERAAHPERAALEETRREGKRYLAQIRAANDAIPGEEISQKLFELETVTGHIFDCLEEHPEKLPDTRRFLQYYLPTTLKLVQSYQKFDAEPVQGETLRGAKREIEHALDTINRAFANLLDSLFADDALDISTDIAALKTMLKQEGLTGSDFDV